jgi:hypothetical protein
MKEHVPIMVIGRAVAIILMFWALRETAYGPFSHRVPPSEVTGDERQIP